MIQSLRRYLTKEELENYIILEDDFSIENLRKAEIEIDNAIAVYYEGGNQKSINKKIIVENSKVTLNATTCIITDFSYDNGYFINSVLEILSGANYGKRIFIKTDVKVDDTHTLTFFDADVGLAGSENIQLFQIAKFPRIFDCSVVDSNIYKSIPEFIKEAVANQYEWRLKNLDKIENTQLRTSYSVARDSYSESFGGGRLSSVDRISPIAMDILDSYGLTIQTI